MKKRLILIVVVLLLLVILISSCFGGKKLGPGKYQVLEAVYEQSDRDYELEVKNYGEYDVKNLKIVTQPTITGMTLEIAKNGSHTLYVKSQQDIIVDQGKASLSKKKKKRRF